MNIVVGLVLVFGCVFGSFLWAGGKMDIVLHALPHEMLTIVGACAGAFIVANSTSVVKDAMTGLKRAAKGEKWKAADYKDMLCLLFLMVKTIRTKGVVAVEPHIERPTESSLFNQFPRIAADHHVVDFICDYVRMLTMNFEDPYQMADAMDQDMESHHAEEHASQSALQTVADGLPAIGIVAAVLGVIKTMGSIDQPTEILGAMIGGALVGTFLGVLLAYCIVGPLAARLAQVMEGDARFLKLIRYVLVAHLQGLPPQVAVEIARRNVPSRITPTFAQLEEAIAELPQGLV
jgi:chemotaxis protein MotA